MMSKLPIDVLPFTEGGGLRFRWKYKVDTAMQTCEGFLPASVEGAVANLIAMCKELQKDNERLWKELEAAGKKAEAALPVKGKK